MRVSTIKSILFCLLSAGISPGFAKAVEPGNNINTYIKHAVNDSLLAFQLNGNAQGTTWHILYYAPAQLVSQYGIDSLLNSVDSSLSIYKPYSLISRFNAHPRGVKLDKMLKTVVEESRKTYKETNGVFDITVLPLVEAWGFGAVKPAGMPDSAAVRKMMMCIGTDKLELRNDSLIKKQPCVRIDVNGIAQGYSVDLIAAYLQQQGIQNYLVELGGEISIRGKKPDGSNMVVGIETPSVNPAEQALTKKISLPKGGAVTTSGNYRKYLMQQGKRISHLLDPHTGFPFQNEMIAVTVIAADATTADALDNALMGMGLKKALAFMQNRTEHAFFIYRDANGIVRDTATKGFAAFVTR